MGVAATVARGSIKGHTESWSAAHIASVIGLVKVVLSFRALFTHERQASTHAFGPVASAFGYMIAAVARRRRSF
jgi:hypothetical protein